MRRDVAAPLLYAAAAAAAVPIWPKLRALGVGVWLTYHSQSCAVGAYQYRLLHLNAPLRVVWCG
jgi:hypothetical protein